MWACLPWNNELACALSAHMWSGPNDLLNLSSCPNSQFCSHCVPVSALPLLFFLQGLVLSKGILSSDTHQLFSPSPMLTPFSELQQSFPAAQFHSTLFCLGAANAFLWTSLSFLTSRAFTFCRAQTLVHFSWYPPHAPYQHGWPRASHK